ARIGRRSYRSTSARSFSEQPVVPAQEGEQNVRDRRGNSRSKKYSLPTHGRVLQENGRPFAEERS
ncbi:MAG: hypothetical protein O7D32_05475, partial [bacterium]|nr:hypothetical protein [bacterium]